MTDIEQKDSSGKHMKVDLPMKNVVFEDNVSDNKQGCFGGFISFCIWNLILKLFFVYI